MMNKNSKVLLAALGGLLSTAALLADVVETKDGARLVGKVSKIDGGTVYLETSYAGQLALKQAEITAISTDADVAVRLASGTRIDGKVTTAGSEVKIASPEGSVSTSVEKIAASWPAGGEDPAVTAMRRKWTFTVAGDISGKSGNTDNSTVGISAVAALTSPNDTLKFYGNYEKAEATDINGIDSTTADYTKAGVDYSSFFSPKYGWYVRSELMKDDVAGVDLRSTSDFGGTMKFINESHWKLDGRLGAGYRYESYYIDPARKGAVLSTGLSHLLEINKYMTMTNDLQYIPAVDDFADYRMFQDTAIEMPIATGFWRLRMGFSNEYTSRPVQGRKNMDMTYYTRLILNWK